MSNLLPIHAIRFPLLYLGLALTSHFLGSLNQLVQGCIFAVAVQSLVPFGQAQRCDHKFSQVLGVRETDCFITSGARDSSLFMGYIYGKLKRAEVSLDVRHAVVVEKKSVMELRPFEVSFTKCINALIPEDIG
jgi:hypothetical protein